MAWSKRWAGALVLHVALCAAASANDVDSPLARNDHLAASNAEQGRFLPAGEFYSIALDTLFWHHGKGQYYHGVASWLVGTLEVKPTERFEVNAQAIAINGNISDGYLAKNHVFVNVGATWRPIDGLEGRIGDMGRLTHGAGLFVEDREAEGGFVDLRIGHFHLRYALAGTGIITRDSDLHFVTAAYTLGRVDVGLAHYHWFDERGHYFESLGGSHNGIYAKTLRSTPVFVASEATFGPDAAFNFMLKAGYQSVGDGLFDLELYAQYRAYAADTIPGATHYEYIAYDLVHRNVTNAHNLMDPTTDVRAFSVHLDYAVRIADVLVVKGTNEYLHPLVGDARFWHRNAIRYCPYADFEASCIGLFVSNKQLEAASPNEQTEQLVRFPGEAPSQADMGVYIDQLAVGVEFGIHL